MYKIINEKFELCNTLKTYAVKHFKTNLHNVEKYREITRKFAVNFE